MNLNHLEAIGVARGLAFALPKKYYDKVDVAVISPFIDLRLVQTLVEGDKLGVIYGAQDVSVCEPDAYTGEISTLVLGKLDCTWATAGHSEHRDMHVEDDELVAKKAKAALHEDMNPVARVGESLEVREIGEHVEYVVSQVKGPLANLTNAEPAKTIIAYESVWAVDTDKAASAAGTQEVYAAIRETIIEVANESITKEMHVLYDDSVKAKNVAEVVDKPGVDGGLVGGASLDDETLAKFYAFAADTTQNVQVHINSEQLVR